MKTYVLNLAMHPAARRIGGKRLEELVFDVTYAALADAGVERARSTMSRSPHATNSMDAASPAC